MPFKDLGDWSDLAALELPIQGKTYKVPPVDAELGPKVQALMTGAINALLRAEAAKARGGSGADGTAELDQDALNLELLSDAQEREFYPRLLGPAYDEMCADKVPWPAVQHAATTVMIDAAIGREAAEQFWEHRALGKDMLNRPSNRAERRATAKRTSTGSTGGTTRRRRKRTASGGQRSSNAGG